MPRLVTQSILAIFVFASACASAEVYVQDHGIWRRARGVSVGQQVWAFQSSYQRASQRFSNSREVQPLGHSYARTVTWRDLLRAEPSIQARERLEDYVQTRGIGLDEVAASAEYDLEREEVGFSVDWAYGLTARWMIGFQVPLMHRRTRVETDVRFTPELAQGSGVDVRHSALALTRTELRERVQGLAEEELANSGYDSIPDEQQSWDVGDVSLLSQVAFIDAPDWKWSLQQIVRFPTARNSSIADYFQTAGDEGQVDLGLTSLLDHHVRRWTWGLRLGYVAQLPDTLKMRVPSTQSGSPEVDPNVSRDLGDWVWASMDSEYRMTARLDLHLEYAFLAKAQDRYDGGNLEGIEYDHLAAGTEQELHQSRLGVQYRLSDTTERNGIENKWVASLGYVYPWIGRNSVDASRTTLELITYF
ncbi:MAG: hypothetical protein AB7G93_02610 [Bdellovibrionales bacterium]